MPSLPWLRLTHRTPPERAAARQVADHERRMSEMQAATRRDTAYSHTDYTTRRAVSSRPHSPVERPRETEAVRLGQGSVASGVSSTGSLGRSRTDIQAEADAEVTTKHPPLRTCTRQKLLTLGRRCSLGRPCARGAARRACATGTALPRLVKRLRASGPPGSSDGPRRAARGPQPARTERRASRAERGRCPCRRECRAQGSGAGATRARQALRWATCRSGRRSSRRGWPRTPHKQAVRMKLGMDDDV